MMQALGVFNNDHATAVIGRYKSKRGGSIDEESDRAIWNEAVVFYGQSGVAVHRRTDRLHICCLGDLCGFWALRFQSDTWAAGRTPMFLDSKLQ